MHCRARSCLHSPTLSAPGRRPACAGFAASSRPLRRWAATVTWHRSNGQTGGVVVTARSFLDSFEAAAADAVAAAAAAAADGAAADGSASAPGDAWVVHAHMYPPDDTAPASVDGGLWRRLVGAAPLVGATVACFRHGSSARPFVSATLLRPPAGGAATAWRTGPQLPLPALPWPSLLARGDAHFLLFSLAGSSRGGRGGGDLVRRLSALEPSAAVAGGVAVRAYRADAESAHFFVSGDGAAAAGAGGGAPVGAVGLALVGCGGSWADAAVVAALGDVEFARDGAASPSGVHASPSLAARLFGVGAAGAAPRWRGPPLPVPGHGSAPVPASPADEPTPRGAVDAVVAAGAPAARPAVDAVDALTGEFAAAPPPPRAAGVAALFLTDSVLFPGAVAEYAVAEPRYTWMLRAHAAAGLPIAVCLPPPRVRDWYDAETAGGDGEAPPQRGARADGGGLEGAAEAPLLPTALPAVRVAPPPAARGACDGAEGATLGVATRDGAPAGAPPPPAARTRVATLATFALVPPPPPPGAGGDGGDGGGGPRGDVAPPAGRVFVRLTGGARVRVHDAWTAPGTFGLAFARVTPLEDDDDDHGVEAEGAPPADAAALAAAIRRLWAGDSEAHALLRRVWATWGGPRAAPPLDAAATASPRALSWLLADALPLPLSLKQAALDSRSAAGRLRGQLAYLQSKLGDLRGAAAAGAAAGGGAARPAPPGAPAVADDAGSGGSVAAVAAVAQLVQRRPPPE